MTITRKYKEEIVNGTRYWIEEYHEKEWKSGVWMWRYGYFDTEGFGRTISDMLRSRPNLKRLKNL